MQGYDGNHRSLIVLNTEPQRQKNNQEKENKQSKSKVLQRINYFAEKYKNRAKKTTIKQNR